MHNTYMPAHRSARMDPVVHFELPAEDTPRAKTFYSEAFEWGLQQLGEDMGSYVIVTTSKPGADGLPEKPGSINGGIYAKRPGDAPAVVVAVEDIKKAMERVEKAGGTVRGKPTEIPGVGLSVGFEDTEGNRLSMLQPFPRMQNHG